MLESNLPAISSATGMGDKTRFVWLHGYSVVLTLAHMAVAGIVWVHMSRSGGGSRSWR